MEIWKGAIYDGVDYSWRLEVSTSGRIRNTQTKRLYSPCPSSSGYLQICISVHKKNKTIRIHRCVAETFLHKSLDKNIVNHIDGNKTNNSLNNLEWVDRRENYRHAVDHELIDPDISYYFGMSSSMGLRSGSRNGMAKLNESDVHYIREHYVHKASGKCNRKELAIMFGVSQSLISQIINYSIWKHI